VALYVPAGRRRRNLILGLVGALVLGLVLGAVAGRATAPTLSDRVSSAQDSVREITARVQATPVEYDKELSGSTEFAQGGTVVQSLTSARRSLTGVLDDAAWIGPTQRKQMEDALAAVIAGARAKITGARYQKLVDAAVTRIEVGFGMDGRLYGL
jgi:hypothetical protein